MPLARSRDYLSIGEVLDSLREEFPDVSISKIRFLEAEGLIAPERTSSGYRKFYDEDLSRLRSILALQRDHFLPLRVIRQRLDDGAAAPDLGPPQGAAPTGVAPNGAASRGAGVADNAGGDMTGVQMTRAELLQAVGLSEAELAELEEFGILARKDQGETTYDENDLVVAKAAKGLFQYGVEARHLKMYRQFAEREAAFFEQIVSPVARRRDPQAVETATRSLHELGTLARQLREGVCRSRLKAML